MGLKMNLEQTLNEITGKMYGKNIGACTDAQLYTGVLQLTKEKMAETPAITGDKKVYYISMEFLIGKLLSNNLINLGIYEELSDILKKNGKNLADIEEAEPEPSLGNGGLGRLAACFLDSIATLGLPGDGIGLNYHFGLFKQVFKDHLQNAEKNDWIQKDSWLNNTGTKFEVAFGDRKVTSVLYDIDVVGYENGLNKLHLFDIETVDESLVKKGITFDKEAIEKNLTLFLYPDDSDEAGNLLRIYQEYFMVCNGAQLILKEVKEKGYDLHTLPEHVAIQINDTHPTMVIPELIRILTTEESFTMDEAIDVVSRTCAYTNHTILAEALEKWPLAYIEKVVPQLVPIIKELSDRVAKKYKDEKVQIIDKDKRVHMAHIDIHYGYSVNGVAAIHTEILKESELNHFYKIYPEKFNNKTNGITFRRWLLSCNHELAAFLTQTIGDGYKKDAEELQKLLEHKDDQAVLDAIYDIKKTKKTELVSYIKDKEGVELNPDSIFDIQVKRLHEYKRQLLCAMLITRLQMKIHDDPNADFTPVTFVFGAKAAAGYYTAKRIIELICSLADDISRDPLCKGKLQVCFMENYRVSAAEALMPAAQVSEQISTAGKEASGTGNMKLMLNGAVTIGTLDGANVEMYERLGDKNMFLFGLKTDEVTALKASGYDPQRYAREDAELGAVLDRISRGFADGKSYSDLVSNLLYNGDPYMLCADFRDYVNTHDRMYSVISDPAERARLSIINTAEAGIFAADRAIKEYAEDIWGIKL